MGINVTALRDKLRFGGARPSLFFCRVTFPTEVLNAISVKLPSFDPVKIHEDFSFFMKAASVPDSTLNEIQKSFLGRDIKIPSIDRTFAPWTVTIMNDEDYRIRHFFEAWIEFISPGASIFEAQSGFGVDAGNYVYGQMQVHQLQKDGGVSTSDGNRGGVSNPYLGSYYFKDAFPTNVSEIALSWDDKDTIEEFTVTFAYQYWVKNPSTLGVSENSVVNPFTDNESSDANITSGIANETNWLDDGTLTSDQT